VSLESVIDRLYGLNVGAVGTGAARHERPHKPVLLLALVEQVERGADPRLVAWSVGLRASFKRLFEVVRRADDRPNPELPFFHLRSDGFWSPVVVEGGASRALGGPPRVMDIGCVFAELDDDVAAVLGDPVQRRALRSALVSRYFPDHRAALLDLPREAPHDEADAPDRERSGRSAAFRRVVVGSYAHRCTACGLQVRLGNPPVSLVDAAHLLPFALSRNDHPTNGLALCKNHHWAMDRSLIAPTPDGVWRSSPILIPHRSSGERELAELDGRRLIPPLDEAHRPSREGLEYRYQRMVGG